ncbi:MAG: bacillithiol biosynthesis cysteine-adding enzyme BshC [Candidatus Kryptoniota bacterium]
MELSFAELPHQTRLLVDYITHFPVVENFYRIDYRDDKELHAHFEKVLAGYGDKRKSLIQLLRKQNDKLNKSLAYQSALEALSMENSLAVVTGQQVGIFTGPLYTIYKTIGAFNLSRNLKERFPEFEFVPVFWLEGDDHDLDETNHVHLFNSNLEVVKIGGMTSDPESENLTPMSQVKIDGAFKDVIGQLDAILRQSDFKQSLIQMLSEFYASGETFMSAFSKTITRFLQNIPFLIFDPTDVEAKHMFGKIFDRELSSFPRASEEVIKSSAQLEETYHVQVKPKVINLFYLDNGKRRSIEPVGNAFSLRGTKRKLMREQLRTLIETNPELFSPNVVLRPICQDYIFPTAAYVGGPAEIAYFAQLKGVYNLFEVDMPPIFPRPSATILEHGVQKIMERYQLSLPDAYADFDELVKKALAAVSAEDIPGEFARASDEVARRVHTLDPLVTRIDPTLKGTLDSTVSRMLYHLQHLQEKTTAAYRRKNDQVLQQVRKFQQFVYPNRDLQERVINFSYFYNKYGDGFIDKLTKELPAYATVHKIISI